MNKFDYRQFIIENRLTTESKLIKEQSTLVDTQDENQLEEGWKETLIGLGMLATTIVGVGKAFIPSAEALKDKEKIEAIANTQDQALDKTSDEDVHKIIKDLESYLNTDYVKFSPSQIEKFGPEELNKLISQEERKVVETLIKTGNEKVKAGFVIDSSGTLKWVNPSKISPI
jgi:hypothetical protein